MNKISLLFFILILPIIFSCKDDDCPPTYKNQAVDFFTSHKDFELIPTTFDTINEVVLKKAAHLEGAIFEMVTEQILIHESYNRYKIMDSSFIQMIIDAEVDTVSEIPCYSFFESSDFEQISVPALYTTYVREIVIQQGTGQEIPATYSNIARVIVDTPAQLSINTEEQGFKRVVFKIPEQRTIRIHLNYYFEKFGIVNCDEGHSYRIVE